MSGSFLQHKAFNPVTIELECFILDSHLSFQDASGAKDEEFCKHRLGSSSYWISEDFSPHNNPEDLISL